MIIQPTREGLNLIREVLESEEVVGIPTETVYGLGGLCSSEKAVQKIYQLKNRPKNNPLILHGFSWEQLNQFAKVEEYWSRVEKLSSLIPGPLSLILPKRESLSYLVTAGSDLVCVRFPAHEVCRDLLQSLSAPLAAPSANLSSFTSCVSAEQVEEEFGGKIYVLDGGRSIEGIESTIVSLVEEPPTVYRLGAAPLSVIAEKLGIEEADLKVLAASYKFPGSFKEHYKPRNLKIIVKSANNDKVCVKMKDKLLNLSKIEFLRNLYNIVKESDKQQVENLEIYASFSPSIFPDYVLIDRLQKMGARND